MEKPWERVRDRLPGKVRDPGRTARPFVNAVYDIMKTGISRDDPTERLGKPNHVWIWYDRWCAAGV